MPLKYLSDSATESFRSTYPRHYQLCFSLNSLKTTVKE
ncbi:hypothetical protein AD16_0989 [Escherichia coli 3-267-03_S4_C2]|nr:hypothetical protein AD16_0989 [Escherichia coli 3-267-03_S4_C2]